MSLRNPFVTNGPKYGDSQSEPNMLVTLHHVRHIFSEQCMSFPQLWFKRWGAGRQLAMLEQNRCKLALKLALAASKTPASKKPFQENVNPWSPCFIVSPQPDRSSCHQRSGGLACPPSPLPKLYLCHKASQRSSLDA